MHRRVLWSINAIGRCETILHMALSEAAIWNGPKCLGMTDSVGQTTPQIIQTHGALRWPSWFFLINPVDRINLFWLMVTSWAAMSWIPLVIALWILCIALYSLFDTLKESPSRLWCSLSSLLLRHRAFRRSSSAQCVVLPPCSSSCSSWTFSLFRSVVVSEMVLASQPSTFPCRTIYWIVLPCWSPYIPTCQSIQSTT